MQKIKDRVSALRERITAYHTSVSTLSVRHVFPSETFFRGVEHYDKGKVRVVVHNKSGVASADCKICGRSIMILPDGTITGSALTTSCEPISN